MKQKARAYPSIIVCCRSVSIGGDVSSASSTARPRDDPERCSSGAFCELCNRESSRSFSKMVSRSAMTWLVSMSLSKRSCISDASVENEQFLSELEGLQGTFKPCTSAYKRISVPDADTEVCIRRCASLPARAHDSSLEPQHCKERN
jgi:hypothetical protein